MLIFYLFLKKDKNNILVWNLWCCMVLIHGISVSSGADVKENDKKCEIESTLVKEAELSGQGRQKGAKGKKVKS